ncbi:hypothetical protein PV10_02616 [Exophiala mesophila]|uniref:Alpha/beta hydrolase fold-3 domain-containing protein n=1 Tax=Exophiala mesophila TaxID=212818 RepID=A0A0D1WZD9_EXOME|nr:uncharacterized protein PV10_02616 [Exophiala mesophila]KIV94895.1 hypothetical protein PV10_02616 [Exophiala mesophila]
MEPSPRALVRLLFPRLPMILKTALLNALRLSKNSSKQTLTIEVAVVTLRSIMGIRRPMKFLQRTTTRDRGIKGPIWISKVSVPPPPSAERDTIDAIERVIKELGNGTETYTTPEIGTVEAEWTGYRKGVPPSEPRLATSEHDQYTRLMGEVSSDVTILYFHGGAYFLMDPSTVRDNTGRLAKQTGGRVYSVRYRLAPQNAFPAQLMDALIAYMSLLSPPPGLVHAPVPAKQIVFAGDSAGANLATALLLLILTLRRVGINTIRYHGRDVSLDIPAGLALNSPWVDICRSLPSIVNNAHLDYLDPPSDNGASQHEPLPDELWPSSPPRADVFCNASILMHPLVSPVAATPGMWEGAPPVFICLGNEALEDEIVVLARRLHEGGAVVDLVGYEGMPHCFAMIFATSIRGVDCYQRWANFCADVVRGNSPRSSRAMWIEAFSNHTQGKETPMEDLCKLNDEDVVAAMETMQKKAMTREAEALSNWRRQTSRPKL